MAKPGRKLPDKERLIKTAVFASVPDDLPGKALGELTADINESVRVDRSTVWRHLKSLEKLRLVIHEGAKYRRNPLINFWDNVIPMGIDEWSYRTRAAINWWSLSRNVWEQTAEGLHLKYLMADLSKPADFQKALAQLHLAVETLYRVILFITCQTSNYPQAREMANLMIDAELRNLFVFFARVVWEQRKTAALDVLGVRLKPADGSKSDSAKA